MRALILVSSMLIGLLTFLLVVLILFYLRQNMSMDIFRRMRRHKVVEVKKEAPNEDLLTRLYRYIKRTAKPFSSLNIAQKLELKIKQAGLPILGAEFIVIALIGAISAGLITYLVTLNRVAAVTVALLVPIGMWIAILFLIRRRNKAFTEQLGDCLATVANALRAGYSFQQAMGVIANEMEPPISEEFARVNTDIAMGMPLEVALIQMNERVNSSDFDLVVTAVLIQREIGGNLAQILDTISDTINERIRMKREILALTAQGRMSAFVLLALPFVTAFGVYLINPGHLKILIDEPMGQIAIAGSLVMELIGYIVIQRIVDIDT